MPSECFEIGKLYEFMGWGDGVGTASLINDHSYIPERLQPQDPFVILAVQMLTQDDFDFKILTSSGTVCNLYMPRALRYIKKIEKP